MLVLSLGILCFSCSEVIPDKSRERISFNQDWHFIKADPAGAEAIDFDDSGWRALDLPHDWGIEGPFTTEVNYKGGYLPYPGTGWYRKTFDIPVDVECVKIEFDGVMRNSKVWFNGDYVGGWPYGYTSFVLDLTDKVKRGGENQIAVRVENQDYSSRWYPGSGIYRNVWLTYTQPVHIAHWGTYVTTPEITKEGATVEVRTTVENTLDAEAAVEVETAILDPGGNLVAKITSNTPIAKSNTRGKTWLSRLWIGREIEFGVSRQRYC